MPDASVESAIRQIRSLCHELAEQRGLAPETRDELCGHMEDKLAGYLRGEVPVTVEDALVLVRAHFGNADAISRDLARQRTSTESSFLSMSFNHQRVYFTLLVITGISTLHTIPLGLLVYALRQLELVSGQPAHVPNWALPWFAAISTGYLLFITVALTARRVNPEAGRRLTRALNLALLAAPPFGTALGLYGLLKVDRAQRQAA
jgi:hypothetical protein